MPEPRKRKAAVVRQSDTSLPPTEIIDGVAYYSTKAAGDYVGMSPAGFYHRLEKLMKEYPEREPWQVHLPGSNKTLIQKDHLDFMLTPLPGPAPSGDEEEEEEE